MLRGGLAVSEAAGPERREPEPEPGREPEPGCRQLVQVSSGRQGLCGPAGGPGRHAEPVASSEHGVSAGSAGSEGRRHCSHSSS